MNSEERYFLSAKEDYPWFQMELVHKQTMNGVNISTIMDFSDLPFEIEIRAGLSSVDSEVSGNITINEVCNKIVPQETVSEYQLQCDSPIIAKFVTIQILSEQKVLGINEVNIISENSGNSECLNEGMKVEIFINSNLQILYFK